MHTGFGKAKHSQMITSGVCTTVLAGATRARLVAHGFLKSDWGEKVYSLCSGVLICLTCPNLSPYTNTTLVLNARRSCLATDHRSKYEGYQNGVPLRPDK